MDNAQELSIQLELTAYKQRVKELEEKLSKVDPTIIMSQLEEERKLKQTLEQDHKSLEEKYNQMEIEKSQLELQLQAYMHKHKEIAPLKSVELELDATRKKLSQTESRLHITEEELARYVQEVEDLVLLNQNRRQSTSNKVNSWANDADTLECFKCKQRFSITVRKHHCRTCGKIFCNDCSDQKVNVSWSPKPVRVCDSCHHIAMAAAAAK